MATANTAPKTPKTPKAPVDLVTRLKGNLSTAALRGKVTIPELEALEAHCAKLRGLLA